MTEDGQPFFWLGDTAWELFHKLSLEEAEHYFKVRSSQGFNVIQAVALAEFDGLNTPNYYGRVPLKKNTEGLFDPTLPDLDSNEGLSYWDVVDKMIQMAETYGLYIGLLPTWGDKYNKQWGKGPEIFTPSNAKIYGKWLGERYKNYNNIIWVLGGDRILNTRKHFMIINSLAEGLKEGDEGRHLITYHPQGGYSSSFQLHEEEWLDFNMIQSGHGGRAIENYKFVEGDYNKLPTKPTLDGEPNYEDHPVGFNANNEYFDEADVRRAAYWAVFSGACGHTYGNHNVWNMNTVSEPYFPLTWKEALSRPGASQLKYLKSLIESRPFFERIPAQDILEENYTGAHHIRATRGEKYAFIYSPSGLRIKVRLGILRGTKVLAQWYNPRTGEFSKIGEYENNGCIDFMPPSRGRGNDWVLILDAE